MRKDFGSVQALVELRTEKVGAGKDARKPYLGLEHLAVDFGGMLGSGRAGDSISVNSKFEKHDILFGKLRPALRKCEQVDFSGYCSTDLLVLRARAGVEPRYAAYVMRSQAVFDAALRSAEGTKMPRTSWSKIRDTAVYLPGLSTQRRIAETLDSVQDMIRCTERLAAKQESRRNALIQTVLKVGSRQSTLGDHITGGPQNGLYKPAHFYAASGTPIVRIDSFDDGVIHSLGRLKRLQVSASEIRTYGLQCGDVLVNRVNTVDLVGKSALVPAGIAPTVFESNIMRLRVDTRDLLPDYAVLRLCGHQALSHFRRNAKSAIGQASINQTDVRSCPMIIPDLHEQRRIVDMARAATEQIDMTHREAAKLRRLRQGLMDDLLTGRVRARG